MNAPTLRERFKPDFPAVVLTYTDALQALADAEGGLTPDQIAERTDRVASNVKRDIPKLRDAEVIAFADPCWTLTDKGRRWLVGQDVARGVVAVEPPAMVTSAAPAGTVLLGVEDIEPDPDNARTHSGLSPLDIEDMAASIRDRVQAGRPPFITPPTVRTIAGPPGAELAWQLVHGERRWRGWRLATSRGWVAEDYRAPCPIFDGDDREATEEALVENLQRSDLDNLEAAEGLRGLSDKTDPPTTAAAMAARLGKETRWVEERLKVAREAEAKDKTRYIAFRQREAARKAGERGSDGPDPDPFNWTALRNSVKKAKHLTALERQPRLAMLVVELAMISDEAHGVWDAQVSITPPPPGGLADVADGLGLIVLNRAAPSAALLSPATDWLAAEGFGEDMDAADAMLAKLRILALGEFGARALPVDQWGTEFLNLPPAPAEGVTVRPGLTGDSFSRQLRESLAGDGEEAPARTQPSAPNPSPEGEATPPANPSTGPASDDTSPTVSSDAGTPPPQFEGDWSPSPMERVMILELIWATREHGQEARGGGIRGAPMFDFQAHRSWSEMAHEKLVNAAQTANGNGFLAVPTPKALAWAQAEYPAGVTMQNIDVAYEAAGVAPTAGHFATAWLNHPPKPPAEPRSQPSPQVPPPAQPGEGDRAEGVVEGAAPAEASKPPNTAPGDIIVQGMRDALSALWLTTGPTLEFLARLRDGEGVGDDDIEALRCKVQQAAWSAAAYVPGDVKAATRASGEQG